MLLALRDAQIRFIHANTRARSPPLRPVFADKPRLLGCFSAALSSGDSCPLVFIRGFPTTATGLDPLNRERKEWA